jgi:XTP/dITP diphosphohydrolase
VKLYCATTNPGKLSEFRLAASEAIEIEPLPGLELVPSCEETGSTFEENAIQKALHYGANCNGYLFAEDSGLEVEALGGAPGVYSARFAGPHATDDQNNALLLDKLANSHNRDARYVCVIALTYASQLLRKFRGEVQGSILKHARGSAGFGYDPLFFFAPLDCTFAELSQERKQTVSHRGQALNAMLAYLREALL